MYPSCHYWTKLKTIYIAIVRLAVAAPERAAQWCIIVSRVVSASLQMLLVHVVVSLAYFDTFFCSCVNVSVVQCLS